MYNKKIVVRGLTVVIMISNFSTNALAKSIDEYETKKEELVETSFDGNIFENIIKSLLIRKTKDEEILRVNKNVIEDSVLVVTLNEGDFIPLIVDNPDGYETIRVITNGNKKLVERDYNNLSFAKIPKIDLSNAYSDSIPAGIFSNSSWLTEFKFPQDLKSIEGTTSIRNGAFYNCRNLTGNLVIPDSVTSIGAYSFYNCSGLTGDLVIPNSVTSIGLYSFYNCRNLTGNLVLGNSVETIGNNAFEECVGFTGDLIIPNSVLTIGDRAFKRCNGFGGNLLIPNSVTDIGNYTFEECSGFTGDLIIPDSITSIGWNVFKGCSGFNGSLVIGSSVKSIGNAAFEDCSGFTGNLVIPDSVTTISHNTFNGCSGFTGSLVIPNSVRDIGGSAFYNCSGFTGNFIIPSSLTDIGNSAFSGCSGLSGELVIPDSVTDMGYYAFENTGIEKIIIKVDENHINSSYKRYVVNALPIENTYVEMSYNLDVSGTWIESIQHIKAQPKILTYTGTFKNNEGIGISLEIIEASDIKEINILKDGVDYTIEKDANGKYTFNDTGNYQVYIETELGTVSNISFKNNSPISMPNLEFNDNTVSIVDNGILSNSCIEKEDSLEDFNDINDLKYSFSNSNWVVENGMLKSETINDRDKTDNQFIVNAGEEEKLQISLKTSSQDNYDWGFIYLNETQVYEKSGTSNDFEVIELDLIEGENTIKFMYIKNSSGSSGDDAMFIDTIKILKNEIITIDCDVLEYRINGGEWQIYNSSFELDYPVGTKVLVEARAKHDGFVSSIFSKEVVIEANTKEVETAVEKAEESNDIVDIDDARDLVNQLPESLVKDQLQDRLNSIFPDIALERKSATSNLDVYIKSENMLSLSLDTNSVTFEDFSGVEDMEKENAINLTVNSSLPYKINAYMPTQIKGSENNIMDNDMLNIRANGQSVYNTFENATTPIVLLDDQPKGNDVTHGIDLMLKGNISHEKNVYKTTVKFEVVQK